MQKSFIGRTVPVTAPKRQARVQRAALKVRAGPYDEELIQTAVSTHPGRNNIAIHAMSTSQQTRLTVKSLSIRYPEWCSWNMQNKVASKGRGILARTSQMPPAERGWTASESKTQSPTAEHTGSCCWPHLAWANISPEPSFLRRHCIRVLRTVHHLWIC